MKERYERDMENERVEGQFDGTGETEEVIDLEAYARDGKTPPEGKRYQIRIDKKYYIVHVSHMTGRQILELAGKEPEKFRLDEKFKGGVTKKIEPAEEVKFTAHGVERFMTLPLDPTEG